MILLCLTSAAVAFQVTDEQREQLDTLVAKKLTPTSRHDQAARQESRKNQDKHDKELQDAAARQWQELQDEAAAQLKLEKELEMAAKEGMQRALGDSLELVAAQLFREAEESAKLVVEESKLMMEAHASSENHIAMANRLDDQRSSALDKALALELIASIVSFIPFVGNAIAVALRSQVASLRATAERLRSASASHRVKAATADEKASASEQRAANGQRDVTNKLDEVQTVRLEQQEAQRAADHTQRMANSCN